MRLKTTQAKTDSRILWGVREVAEALGQHPQTTRAWLLTGAIPRVRLPSARAKCGSSNRILVRKADVLKLIEDSTESV